MDQKIAKIYAENFYPSLNELYKILQEEGINITKAKVKEFLDLQLEQQITKESRPALAVRYLHITEIRKI